MNFSELMYNRQSCRGYDECREVEQEKLDAILEAARLAPSAVNSQPWYFAHEGDTIHVFCSNKGSRLDAGIALAHLYVANEESFRFFKAEHIADLPGYTYIGSATL